MLAGAWSILGPEGSELVATTLGERSGEAESLRRRILEERRDGFSHIEGLPFRYNGVSVCGLSKKKKAGALAPAFEECPYC